MPCGAAKLHGNGLAAVPVAQLDGPAALVEPTVAPLHQRHKRWEQVRALGRQLVALPGSLSGLAVILALEQPLIDKFAQPGGGNRLADLRSRREVIEPRRPVERLAQDQERRAGADDLKRLGDRAPVGRPRAAW